MRKLIFIFLCFLTCQVVAETGDELTIITKILNMRSGPSTEEPVLLKLEQGRKLIEIRRQGRWIEVATSREDIPTGWVYSTLVRQESGHKKTEAHEIDSVFDLFELALAEFNEKSQAQIGYVPFANAEHLERGNIVLTATDEWLALPRIQKEAQLSEVFVIWAAAVGEGRSITISIVDKDGNQSMSMLR